MNNIFAVNLFVPLLVIIIIAGISGCFGIRKKGSIKGELFEYFKKTWNEGVEEGGSDKEGSFFQKFFDMFVQAYEYERYKESVNKLKYYFYKLLVLIVILCIPFLVLFLITRKEWVLQENEWNDIYLYTVILVPLIFAYLINKYIRIRQYHQIWYRHLKNRHYMEWRMMVFVKDCELMKSGVKGKETDVTFESLKVDFVNDMSEYWKTETAGVAGGAEVKEENIFEDIGSLFHKD